MTDDDISRLEQDIITLQLRDLEIRLLLLYIKSVVIENECLCGAEPFTDGNPCSVCAGQQLLCQFRDYPSKVDLPKKGKPLLVDPQGRTLLVNLDRMTETRSYLDRINDTPFKEMVFVKDRQPVELMAETLEKWSELGLSNVEVLKKIYQGTWGND